MIFHADPLSVTVTSAESIVFAVGPIAVPEIADECADRRQFVADGFELATIEVGDASDVRSWHQKIVTITTAQDGEWILQGPGNAPTITANSVTDADKRLLAGLNENEAGLSVSVFVRPRFRYDGGDVENIHYLRWNDNGVLDDNKSLVDPMLISRSTEADGAFDVLVTANLRAIKKGERTTPVVRA